MSYVQSTNFGQAQPKADVSKSIQRYIDSHLTLAQTDITEAAKSREWALKRIRSEIETRKSALALYAEQPFVPFGSYPKKTKVKEVDEFDILVVIDSNEAYFYSWGVSLGQGLGTASPNHIFDDQFMKMDGSGVSPAELLNWLQDVVEVALEPYGVEFPVQDGPALTVYLKTVDLRLDLVPAAIFRRYSDGNNFYTILSGKDSWLKTAPHFDMERLAQAADGRENFRNTVRIAKRIKDTHGFDVSSFAIETAIVDYAIANRWWDDLQLDVCKTLSYLAARFDAGAIYDPFDTSLNLLAESNDLASAKRHLEQIVWELLNCSDLDDQSESDLRVEMAFEAE